MLRSWLIKCVAITGFFSLASATAAQPVLLPGIGPRDPRHPIDVSVSPWRGLGRVQSGGRAGRCSGALITPNQILTAAHCLWSPTVRRFVSPEQIHFLLRYTREQWDGHGIGLHVTIGPGYDPSYRNGPQNADWAIVTLDHSIGSARDLLPVVTAVPMAGTPAMLAGYDQDHAEIALADTQCAIMGITLDHIGHSVLQHSCSGTRGTSGAPLLVREKNGWAIAGVQSAAEIGLSTGWAAMPTRIEPDR